MLSYILQVVFFQLLFLLVYEFLLKKETFFTYNRWYLLLTASASFIVPFVSIEELSFLVPAGSLAAISNVWLPEILIGGSTEKIQYLPEVELNQQDFTINWWLVSYAFGVFGSLFLLLKKVRNLSSLFLFRKISAERDLQIIEVPNSNIACTFYKTIFLGDRLTKTERSQILRHELVHVKQKHSLDLIFFELLKIVFWFNPLIYSYQSRIAALHEFIADASVVITAEKRSYYETLLNSAFNTSNISFINQFFNHSLIKKRILMLQKSKSKTIAKFKYLILVPLMLVMLTYVSCSEDKFSGNSEEASISQQLDKLQVAIEQSDELSKEDHEKIIELTMIANKKSTNGVNSEVEKIVGSNADVPFGVIEQAPVFPGCESFNSNDEQKKCMTEKISEHVMKNFNSRLAEELGIKGVNRIIVQFRIDSNGNVVEVKARAPHPDLETEAKRIISSLPQMQPGKQGGKVVGVVYSLPIVFQGGE